MQTGTTNIQIIEATAGDTLGVAGNNYRMIVTGAKTAGAYSCFDMLVPPGGGPAPHAHPKMQEFFYVVEGEVTFKTQAGRATIGKGGFIHIPFDGGAHAFKNESGENARLLCTVMPAGLEAVFALIGTPVAPGQFLPVQPVTAAQKEQLKTLGEQFGQTIYPPDYLD